MAPTQDALYRELDVDPDLSWSERDLPERERTKHVHRLHPYLGKYVPQLVEALLARHLPRAKTVLDPFAGSGTTLVQSLESGRDAVGVDVAAFNCLLMQVKTGEYNLFTLERELRDSLRRLKTFEANRPRGRRATSASGSRRAPPPSSSSSAPSSTSTSTRTCSASCSRGPLARRAGRRTSTSISPASRRSASTGATSTRRSAARSSAPSISCVATRSTRSRGSASSRACARVDMRLASCTATPASSSSPGPFDGVVTSPPYPGLIDYHEQHRYAYELLGLDDERDLELGAAERGVSAKAIRDYVDGIAAAFANVREALRPRAPVVIVINDRRDLYPEILERAGLTIERATGGTSTGEPAAARASSSRT